MKSMPIYITEQQHTALKRIYAETGMRMSEIIRIAIDEYLKKNEVN